MKGKSMLPKDRTKFDRVMATLVESIVVLFPYVLAGYYTYTGTELPGWLVQLLMMITAVGTVRWAGKGTVKAAKNILGGGKKK